MLKGTMYITDDINIIYNTPINQSSKIVSLDEDGVLDNYKEIIGGTCLLPPMEAKIAEADGNEQLYDSIYSGYLMMPFQQQFIAALIAYIYKGGNIIFFLPEIGYNNTTEKFVFLMYELYGVHIGMINNPNPQKANWFFDLKCIPIWLNLIYVGRVISAEEYLYMYPLDARIENESVIQLLIEDLRPYGNSINDMMNYILHFHKAIHKNPKVKQVLCKL